MSENLKKVSTAAACLLAMVFLYIVYRQINTYSYETCLPPCMRGYYETTPAFLEAAELSSMSLVMNDSSFRLLYTEGDELVEVDCSVNLNKFKSIDNIISLDCSVESDIDHPLTNSDLSLTYSRDTGELIIEKEGTVLANMVKDNMISIHM